MRPPARRLEGQPAAPCHAPRAVAGRRRAVPGLGGRPLPGAARAQRPAARIAARAGARDQVPRAHCHPLRPRPARLPSLAGRPGAGAAPGCRGRPGLPGCVRVCSLGYARPCAERRQDRVVPHEHRHTWAALLVGQSAVQLRQEAMCDAQVGARMHGRLTRRGRAGGAARQRQWQFQVQRFRLRGVDQCRPPWAGWRCGATAACSRPSWRACLRRTACARRSPGCSAVRAAPVRPRGKQRRALAPCTGPDHRGGPGPGLRAARRAVCAR